MALFVHSTKSHVGRPPRAPHVRVEQPRRSATRALYKAAASLHAAHYQQLLNTIDPSSVIAAVRKRFSSIDASFEKKAKLYISHGLFSELQLLAETMDDELRTLRDTVEKAFNRHLLVEAFSAGTIPSSRGLKAPSIRQLIEDLQTLKRNFDGLTLLPEAIVVTTAPITLYDEDTSCDVELGKFNITLDLVKYRWPGQLLGCYTVTAVTPVNPKDGDNYVHPHVQDGVLCEGAAREAIEEALTDGRFYDFFYIVNNTLITYNPDSPHLELSAWVNDSVHCGECGESINPESNYTTSCAHCDQLFCERCISYCDAVEESICSDCLRNCSRDDCDSMGVSGCLDHENESCEICNRSPSDEEQVICDADMVFHYECISNAGTLPSVCAGCSCIDDCSYLPASLKLEDE